MRRIIIMSILALSSCAAIWFFVFGESTDTYPEVSDPTSQPATQTDQQAQPDTQKNFIRIAALGDMLPHDTVNLRAQTGTGYDYLPYFSEVNQLVADSDIVFCNQESPSAGESFGISGYPSFNAPEQFARDLNTFGCNVINLANNHIADKGQGAIDATIATWQGLNPLAVSGANSSQAEQNQVSYFEVSGKRFAFIAFTDLSNNRSIADYSVNMFGSDLVTRLSLEAAANADYVIASAHWGTEDSDTPTQAQRDWARIMADNGVDFIIGTGPHVLQPVDTIGDTIVYYSIGNFLSTQLTLDQLTGGVAYIDIPLDGSTPQLSFAPTYMHYAWTAAEAGAEDLLARDNLKLYPLSEADEALAASLFDTNSAAIRSRVTALLNQEANVEILD